MHIQDGMIPGSIEGILLLSVGTGLAAIGTAWGLRKLDYDQMPQVAMLSSAFFVASFIHVPIGPTSTHLVLNGLVGLILGWAAFPALLVGLFLQAILFGYGGLTTLGINTLAMALPAVICHGVFRRAIRAQSETVTFLAGFAAGALGILLGGVVLALALVAVGERFVFLAEAVLVAHMVVAVIEGLLTGSVVVFLRKVRPELLEAPLLAPGRSLELPDA